MSEMAARSCDGKKRHRSERKAKAAAKVTQKLAGVHMKHYPCPYCKGFHVGSVEPQQEGYMRTSRDQRIQVYTNYNRDRTDKRRFGR
jgi:hypothetical protein